MRCRTGTKDVGINALFDTGADVSIIHSQLVKKHALPTTRLPVALRFRNADNTVNSTGQITERIEGDFLFAGESFPTDFYVAEIGVNDAILGMPWIRRYNPTVNFITGQFTFSLNTIQQAQQERMLAYRTTPPSDIPAWGLAPMISPVLLFGALEAYIRQDPALASIGFSLPDQDEEERPSHSPDFHIQRLLDKRSNATSNNIELQMARQSASVELAAAAAQDKPKKPLEELVPEYLLPYRQVFDDRASERMPPTRPYDHAIELLPDFKPRDCKVYPLSTDEHKALEEFIAENLRKGYIRESSSPMASPFFFVKKKDGKLRPVQDYRRLNEGTVKNVYPLPLISSLIERIKDSTLFTKLDIRAGYNNIRIREGDQWKAAFKTPLGLFEPTVMFFGLCNAPATFQAAMNDIFRDFLAEGWLLNYMDDFLIHTRANEREKHRQCLIRLIVRMIEHDLYLKPEKCEFEQSSVEWLGAVFKDGTVSMDPVKLDGIDKWPDPKTVREVQQFLGFANFYRRFIPSYSSIAKPLTELTRKGQRFEWTAACAQAFHTIKGRFMERPILLLPRDAEPFQVECDASKVATGAVLRQKGPDGEWHPVAYLSKTLTDAERNYQIHDRELLAIIRALEAWRHYLQGSPHPVQVLTDHKNLLYFRTAQNLNRRQARWALFLAEYNIHLVNRPGHTLVQADALSRRPDHDKGDHDNEDVVLLPNHLFINLVDLELRERIRTNSARDTVVTDSLTLLQKRQPPVIGKKEDWTEDDGITLFRNKVYVPLNEDLRRDIVSRYHDPPVMGHPGIQKTYELVQREYWWPGLRQFVVGYVKGCADCQTAKVDTHPTNPGIHPIPHRSSNRPFAVITMDYATDLPPSNGYDAVQVVVDHDVTKAIVLSPCTKTITAMGAADLLQKDVYTRFGLPDHIISDRGPQFASAAFRELGQKLGIHTHMSTAHHPQTDGQSERTIQELGVALRIYCANHPDTWSNLLSQFEFAHNQREHSSTKKAPFELLLGYNPPAIPNVRTDARYPAVEERLRQLRDARENTIASHRQAAEAMVKHPVSTVPRFQVGDKVFLDSRHIQLPYPSRKFAPRREGPFRVTDVLGPTTVRLDLPRTWRIHPVFHTSLLRPYHTTKEHGPNYVTPPPDLVDTQEEYEVESIINHRKPARGGLQYLVTWRNAPPHENQWLRESALRNASTILRAYKRAHHLA